MRTADAHQIALAAVEQYGHEAALEVVRKTAYSNVVFFTENVLGYKVQPFHAAWLRHQENHRKTVLLAPRGHGKSTACTVAFVLWKLVKNPNLRVLIASKTSRQAALFLKEIKTHMERNRRFRLLFGDWVHKDEWKDTQIRVPRTKIMKEPTITAVGIGNSLPTWHFDLIVVDDVHDVENSRTMTQREYVWKWFEQVVLPTLEPDGELHVIGTRWHKDDLYGRLMQVDRPGDAGAGEYAVLVDRAIIDEEKGRVLWPDRWPLELLQEIRLEQGPAIFALQYQCDAEAGSRMGLVFDAEKFFVVPEAEVAKMLKHPETVVVQAWDLATGQEEVIGKARGEELHSDYTACVTTALTADNTFIVVDWWRGRVGLAEQLSKIKQLAEKWKVDEVGIESVAYQAVISKHLARTTTLPVRRLNPDADKFRRAWRAQPYVEQGRVGVVQSCLGLRDLLASYPYGEEDDSVDAFVYTVDMLARREKMYRKAKLASRHTRREGV